MDLVSSTYPSIQAAARIIGAEISIVCCGIFSPAYEKTARLKSAQNRNSEMAGPPGFPFPAFADRSGGLDGRRVRRPTTAAAGPQERDYGTDRREVFVDRDLDEEVIEPRRAARGSRHAGRPSIRGSAPGSSNDPPALVRTVVKKKVKIPIEDQRQDRPLLPVPPQPDPDRDGGRDEDVWQRADKHRRIRLLGSEQGAQIRGPGKIHIDWSGVEAGQFSAVAIQYGGGERQDKSCAVTRSD